MPGDTDVSALEAENQRFRELFRQAPGFVAIGSAPEFRFEFVNEAYKQLVGDRELVGKTVEEALPEVVSQGFVDLLHAAVQTKRAVERRGQPVLLARRDSEPPQERIIDFIYQPILSATGEVTGILCAGYDVTDQHAERARADELQQSLMHVNRLNAMGAMAGTLAHELNQPLAAASAYLTGAKRLLERERVPVGILDAVDGSIEQIQRAGAIIRAVRASLSAKSYQTVDLRTVITCAIKQVVRGNDFSSIVIDTSLGENAHFVRGDQLQLEQVVGILIKNACQAMHDSPVKALHITSKPAGPFVQLTVSDTGSGLPPSMKDDPFGRVGQSTTGGLGLGLALARTMVGNHDGKIWVEHTSDAPGTTFIIQLPMGTV